MFRKITIAALAILTLSISSNASALTAYECTSQARALLTTGSRTDITNAYYILNTGFYSSPEQCPDCSDDRELIFLHAMTRLAMWGVGNKTIYCAVAPCDDPTDSFVELAQLFDVELIGDIVSEMEVSYPKNKRDAYQPPHNYQQIALDVLAALQANGPAEINAILAELDLIYDTPEDPFNIILYPHETGLNKEIEFDYGELMAIKAILYFISNIMATQIPYDIRVDVESNQLIEKNYTNLIDINKDILDPHPYLGQLLPTPNDPNDGAASLAQLKANLITAINLYLDAVDYIQAETDPQDNDIIVITPEFSDNYQLLENMLISLQASIIDDTSFTLSDGTEKYYRLEEASDGKVWDLELYFNPINQFKEGYLQLISGSDNIQTFDVIDYCIEDDQIILEIEGWYWGYHPIQGFLEGTIDANRTTITNAALQYWGYYSNTHTGISGYLQDESSETETFDLNPIFGNSARYPNPINPRDILPLYDEYGYAIPGTIGHGMGDDPTLGGILPGLTQLDWTLEEGLQLSDIVSLQEIEPWQRINNVSGYYTPVEFWLEDQLVFTDWINEIYDDTEPHTDCNVDIEKLYLGFDDNNLYGLIKLNDNNTDYDYYSYYNVYFSYSPENVDELDTIKIRFHRDSSGHLSGYISHRRCSKYNGSSQVLMI